MKTIQMKCNGCGQQLEYDANKQIIFCPYCGSKELVIEDDPNKIEAETKIRLRQMENEYKKDIKSMKIKQERSDLLITLIAVFIIMILFLIAAIVL